MCSWADIGEIAQNTYSMKRMLVVYRSVPPQNLLTVVSLHVDYRLVFKSVQVSSSITDFTVLVSEITSNYTDLCRCQVVHFVIDFVVLVCLKMTSNYTDLCRFQVAHFVTDFMVLVSEITSNYTDLCRFQVVPSVIDFTVLMCPRIASNHTDPYRFQVQLKEIAIFLVPYTCQQWWVYVECLPFKRLCLLPGKATDSVFVAFLVTNTVCCLPGNKHCLLPSLVTNTVCCLHCSRWGHGACVFVIQCYFNNYILTLRSCTQSEA